MIIKTSSLYGLLLVAIFLCYSNSSIAQNLPKLQTEGVVIPPKVTIDGKLAEWGYTTQAFNRNAKIGYTIANDKNRIYICLQTHDAAVIRKLIAGSVSVVFASLEDKNRQSKVTVTFPVFESENLPNINLTNKPQFNKDSVAYKLALDSFVRASNSQLLLRTKEIKVIGGKNIDTLISIYNAEGRVVI
jgi:hypothetical protein